MSGCDLWSPTYKKQEAKPLPQFSFLQRTPERGGKAQCVLNGHVCAARGSLFLAALEALFPLGPHGLLLEGEA